MTGLKAFSLGILVLIGCFLTEPLQMIQTAQAAPTVICGSLVTTTWTTAGSPYGVCPGGATIPSGVTLTIDPGVTVQVDPGGTFNVQGNLVAIGNPASPITFTGSIASSGSWWGINVNGSPKASLTFDNVTINYGGVSGSGQAAIIADQAALTILHSAINSSLGNGVYVTYRGSLEIRSSSFTGNGQNAIQLDAPSGDLNLSGLTATGNGSNAVLIHSATTVTGQRHWSNPGIPYLIDAGVANLFGNTLTLEAGSTLQFASTGFLSIGGGLQVMGTPTQPVLLTGQTPSPGSWRGLVVFGGTQPATAQLEYTTVEYGGSDASGADIYVSNGMLVARHSIIRNSSKDGVRFDSNAGGSILESQITGNTFGVRNATTNSAVLATNNWWGDPGGPHSDLAPACGTGAGDKVTAGVLFVPFLTSTVANVDFPLSNAPVITLTPRRWFAPADNLTKVYFDITLTDGNGAPLPGRTVRLKSNLGTVTDGGITDITGKTLAYLLSAGTGDALVTATLDASTACEYAMSPQSKITFTAPLNLTELFPNSPAPYLGNDIDVTPLPAIQGVPATVSASLTNPLPQPITVDLTFGFVQSGVGLVFGPLGAFPGEVIPAGSTRTFSLPWTPVVSGHYCFEVQYNITSVGAGPLNARLLAGSSGRRQRNLKIYQPGLVSPPEKSGLQKTKKSLEKVNSFIDTAFDTTPFKIPLRLARHMIDMLLSLAQDISNSLTGDPPTQDYRAVTIPARLAIITATPTTGVTPADAVAFNDLANALADLVYDGGGAAVSIDRNGGASEANSLQWASIQANAFLYFKQRLVSSLTAAADKVDAFTNLLVTEAVPDIPIPFDVVLAYQDQLKTTGFSADDINDYHAAGFSDAQIENRRQQLIAADPTLLGESPRTKLQDLSASFRQVSDMFLHPQVFVPTVTAGSAGTALAPIGAAASGNTMVQVYQVTETFPVSNPGSATATIDVRYRRIDLPADWMVTVSPAQATLDPGGQVPVTVQIAAGSPISQGRKPRIAVEGYAGAQLLGGVVLDVLTPQYIPFDGKLHLYLPLIEH